MSNIKKSCCPEPYEDYASFSPLEIEIKGFSFEEGVRRFRTIVQKSKIIPLFKEKQSFEKPSEKRRRKRREAVEKRRLAELRETQMANGEWEKKIKRKEEKEQKKRKRLQNEK